MNRTALFLALAATLALVALLVGRPRPATPGPTPGVAGILPPHLPSPTPASPLADGSLRVTPRLSHPVVPVGVADVFLTVDVEGVRVPGAARIPVNLALVVDRSGSMNGHKLAQAKRAAHALISQLTPRDRLAIVHYGSDVAALHSLPADAGGVAQMRAYVDGIWDDGGTNISAGLVEARRQLLPQARDYRVNRVILLSDGQPTEGVVHDEGLEGIARQLRADGLTVSALGVGEDFNEDLMKSLAEYGAGAYGYLEDATRMASLFERDLQAAAATVARRVELQLALPEGVTLGEVLGHRAQVSGRTVRIPLPDVEAGGLERVVARLSVASSQVGRVQEVVALQVDYTDVLRERAEQSHARLTAEVTERPEEALARQDRQAAVYAARALAARNTELAAEALREGRTEEAKKSLLENLQLFEQARSVAGPEAVAADEAEQRLLLQQSEAAAAAPEVQGSTAKSMKVRAYKGYGRLNSTR